MNVYVVGDHAVVASSVAAALMAWRMHVCASLMDDPNFRNLSGEARRLLDDGWSHRDPPVIKLEYSSVLTPDRAESYLKEELSFWDSCSESKDEESNPTEK